ncbi:MAG: glutamate--tRNA ligase [Chloroflexi bacterium]|nr:glutamate--tRNA ligase [Chloroflexota bacterium]
MTSGMRVRMAPSPTGDIHIGNARTALMNYLLARQSGGTFILRVEDTDRERSDAQKEAGIYDGLRWLSLDWDEGPNVGGPYGPYRQSERHEVHREAIEALLASNAAYYDYTTAEERAAEREAQIARGQTPRYSGSGRSLTSAQIAERQAAGVVPAVRFASGSGAVGFDDGVFGPLTTDASEIEDFVIARGDGTALYNMAVVADDRSMAITHVVRGADHTSNTFRQVLLYRALGWEPPNFAHLPLLLNKRRQKLSKRDGSQWLGEYRAQGYLPEAVVNFMVFLGWSPGDERELFSLDDLVDEFSLQRVNRADAVYDVQRLDHFNGVWLRQLDMDALAERALPFARDGGLQVDESQRDYFQQALALEQERIGHLSDVPDVMGFFFDEDLDPDVELMRFKRHDRAETAAALTTVEGLVRELPEYTIEAIETMLRGLAERLGWKTGDLFMPIRIAVTGRRATPPLFETMAVLGRERCLVRLQRARDKLDD